ncbi:DUF2769 domain-containing protein [Methanoculleus taiwanensis]|uniref:DUF2769 domain-containing protein n=1 Tax=Methanoculleus taiwanensis TaxID=1550565 RepID=UPI000FFF164E|nr:DUF2769 domain-containing protein [Methanoculleus taiwanensis]
MSTADEEIAILAAKIRRAAPGLAAREEQERQDALKALREICICPGCPTYNVCAEQAAEKFFCAEGGSTVCIQGEHGCLCPDCPVHAEMGLSHRSFCTRDSETVQGYGTPER